MKYVLAIFGIFVIIILAIIMLRGGGDNNKTQTAEKKVVKLSDYTDDVDTELKYTIDGPINAQENHRSIRITVSATERRVEVFRGYQNEVMKRESFPNTSDAFKQFLDALTRAQFVTTAKGRTTVNQNAVCPTGNRTTYEIVDGGQEAYRSWSASCTGGTFAGNVPLTRQLFRAQIPSYNKVVSGTSVSGL